MADGRKARAVGIAVLSASGNTARAARRAEEQRAVVERALAEGVDPSDREEIARRLKELDSWV